MKTVFITGAGSGIGKALAEVFTKNGWETYAPTHPQMDVTDQKSIDAYIRKLNGKPLDVLINNAGVYDYSLEKKAGISTEKIAEVFKVNTIGPYMVAHTLLDNLRIGSEKLVVSISSMMGTYAAINNYGESHWSYSASKAALNFAMIAFGVEHPDLKSVLLHPGWVKTYIGGEGAVLEPEFAAGKIYELIADHKRRLQNLRLTDYRGNPMDF